MSLTRCVNSNSKPAQVSQVFVKFSTVRSFPCLTRFRKPMRSPALHPLSRLVRWCLLCGSVSGYHLSVVFSAECNPLFDWHSVALVHSYELHELSQTGSITRLLACSEEERVTYPNLELGAPAGGTFVHRNMRDDPLVDEKGYPSYNKPYSVMAWLRDRNVAADQEADPEEYVLMTDADMIFRSKVSHICISPFSPYVTPHSPHISADIAQRCLIHIYPFSPYVTPHSPHISADIRSFLKYIYPFSPYVTPHSPHISADILFFH